MSNAFLEALKAKSPKIEVKQVEIAKKVEIVQPESIVVTGYTHNQDEDLDQCLNGTYLLDHVKSTYENLVDLFGKPLLEKEGKVEAMWLVRLSNGEFFSIYNWKNSTSYLGDAGLLIQNVTQWNIGGNEESRSGLNALIASIGKQVSFKIVPPVRPVDPIEQKTDTDAPKDAYQEYRTKCRFLCDHYGIDAADLALLAVDCLYRKTLEGMN